MKWTTETFLRDHDEDHGKRQNTVRGLTAQMSHDP